MSAQNLAVFVGTAFLVFGAFYRYKIRHIPLGLGDGLILICLSYVAAGSIIYVLGGIDFVFFNSSFLGYASKDVKVLVLIGSLGSLYVVYYYFCNFLRQRGRARRK